MINHGHWEAYTPTEPPIGAPDNTIYWTDGSRDWYDFSRQHWNVVSGVDSSGTVKVSVVFGGLVSCVTTDVTRLMLPGKFQLFEMEEMDTIPKPGWYFNGDGFYSDRPYSSIEERRALLPNISARQLWLMALDIGITKSSILTSLETMEDKTEAERLRIELTEPPLNGYERLSPAVETLREMQGIPEAQFDDLWAWASQIK